MRLKYYQLGELFGIVLLLASTAMQLFYLEPLKREIEWRLVAFNTPQSAQIQLRTVYDNQVALLKLLNAAGRAGRGDRSQAQRHARPVQKLRRQHRRLHDRQGGCGKLLEVIVIALFALGSLMAGLGRALEMSAARNAAGEG